VTLDTSAVVAIPAEEPRFEGLLEKTADGDAVDGQGDSYGDGDCAFSPLEA
jgi:hypothetical protein